ncbi:MAG: hypothetical protein L6R39_004234 [Caloplaca ligustica]|nr:MAG: hypothetical protein L6R39_004234 [Caloplaca ligustica]
MPLDHFSLIVPVDKLDPMVNFLTQALQHMGFKEHIRFGPCVVGMGETTPYFWLAARGGDDIDENRCLAAAEQVEQFYDAALKAGATDNGPPGLRPQYHPGYYAAFVLDPVCGVNFEVVCHKGADASETS